MIFGYNEGVRLAYDTGNHRELSLLKFLFLGETLMKGRTNHLKRIQKQVLRSARQEESKQEKEFSGKLKEEHLINNVHVKERLFDEVIPANQQVPRVGLRHSYH